MSDEIKVTQEKNDEHKCFCQSKGFKKFLTIALGTFVGVYCALCLFTALHKPPMIAPQTFGPNPAIMGGCPCRMIKHNHHHYFDRDQRQDAVKFQKPINAENRVSPFEAQRPNAR